MPTMLWKYAVVRIDPLYQIEHRAADEVDAAHHLRVDVGVERIRKRRHEHPRRRPTGLVLVVHDLRQPLPVEQIVDDPRLRLRLHVGVAVVVVADVLLVEPRHRAVLVRRADVFPIPVDHEIQAVGVDRGQQHEDDVVADLAALVRFVDGQLMRQQEGVLRGGHFAGMQAVVDPDDGLAFTGKLPRRLIVDAAHVGKLAADLTIVLDAREVGFRRDQHDENVVALGRLPRRVHGHTVRRGVERREVLLQLPEVGELVIVAGRKPQHLCRGRDRLKSNR
jgi:hypothetical protein